MHIMVSYKGYYHKSISTSANFTEIGIVKLEDMGSLPFFAVHHKGHQLHIKSEKRCAETQGDCYKFTEKYLDLKWMNVF